MRGGEKKKVEAGKKGKATPSYLKNELTEFMKFEKKSIFYRARRQDKVCKNKPQFDTSSKFTHGASDI